MFFLLTQESTWSPTAQTSGLQPTRIDCSWWNKCSSTASDCTGKMIGGVFSVTGVTVSQLASYRPPRGKLPRREETLTVSSFLTNDSLKMTMSQERLQRDHESLSMSSRLGKIGVSHGQTVGFAPRLSKSASIQMHTFLTGSNNFRQQSRRRRAPCDTLTKENGDPQ